MKYDFASIEKKWQQKWLEEKPFTAVTGDKTREKFFGLIEFPYPSGQGLHVGHARPFTAMDIICRKKRMQGYNVLFPIGYDAFGLPTENYAVQHHIHPAKVTHDNIENFRKQLHMLGYSFDWDREVNTTDPSYYKWTQWIFLQMFKKGLAYKASMPVNWCTSCKIVLANEEVVDGVCERCGGQVIRKEKSQWMLAITKYADRLIDDLDDLDFIERVKIQQKNWIGRSEGTEVDFTATNGDKLTVYTTRCDTLFGVTYMVISPEHPYLQQWKDQIQNWDAVAAYIEEAARKSDFERGELNKEKTGVRLEGIEAVNPASGKHVPLFVSDYVLMGYGTGIVMGVPGHDQRDWEFATKFGLPIVEVVQGGDITKEAFTLKDDTGIMVNSGFLDGLTVKEAIPTMKKWVTEQGIGRPKTNFKLRDWVFSRQRYWGEPIPLVNCPKCGWVPLPEEQLPLLLPEFCRRHPEMGIQLHEQGEEFLEDGVRQGEIDLAIGVLDTGYPELCYEKLAEEPVLLAIPRSYACVRDLPLTEATPARPYAIPPAQVNGLPFLLPYPGNGSYRSSKLLLHEAGVRPGRILSYSNMSTARQLCALGLGALFVTGALFERTLPGGQERIAFCTLQQPVYTRTSVAAYRPENPRAALCREAIALTRELVLPRLELPV